MGQETGDISFGIVVFLVTSLVAFLNAVPQRCASTSYLIRNITGRFEAKVSLRYNGVL